MLSLVQGFILLYQQGELERFKFKSQTFFESFLVLHWFQ